MFNFAEANILKIYLKKELNEASTLGTLSENHWEKVYMVLYTINPTFFLTFASVRLQSERDILRELLQEIGYTVVGGG